MRKILSLLLVVILLLSAAACKEPQPPQEDTPPPVSTTPEVKDNLDYRDESKAMTADEGSGVTSDIARRMGIGMTNASNLRRRLIDRGIIKSMRMGLVAFDMPILEAYLREHPGEW